MKSQDRQPRTLERVEAWLETSRRLGYQIRYDHFGGSGGGVCEFGGQKWVFLDVSLSAIEQLEMLEQEIPKDADFEKDAGFGKDAGFEKDAGSQYANTKRSGKAA